MGIRGIDRPLFQRVRLLSALGGFNSVWFDSGFDRRTLSPHLTTKRGTGHGRGENEKES